jgi:hypothetical protein
MGKFYAYKKEGDTLDVELDTSSNITYYRIILSRAFGETNFALSTDATAANIGTIDLRSSGLADEAEARKRIAEEEGKYFFRWRDKDNEDVMSDHDPVLKKLERVNVLLYWYTGHGLFDTSMETQLLYQDSSIKKLPDEPLKFEKINEQEGKLKISVQTKAIPLYQDTVETTKLYKYKLVNEKYVAVRTWIPDKVLGHDVTKPENYNPHDKGVRVRYHQWVLGKAECGGKKKPPGCGKNNPLPDVYEFCVNDDDYRKWLGGLTAETKKRIEDSAEDAAKQIPQKYDCYYYADGDKIDGFLAKVILDVVAGSSETSSGGYKGRADKVTEINYLWDIVPASNTPKFHLAKVLSHLIGLDRNKYVGEKNQVGTGYHQTNYPCQRADKSGQEAAALLFRYFKEFLPDKERRNEPKNNPPIAPRLYPTRPKNLDKSFRKWKKGLALDGEGLGFGSKADKSQAGPAMAKALRGFEFYATAEKKSLGVINMSKLPATAFARYVLTDDEHVQNQWKIDNGLPLESALDGNALRTEQDWCHLYGHGDGGKETFHNFVSGSVHCNTEQLAIETGQRRVSQNQDIPAEIRIKLMWRITAELYPNIGSVRKAPELGLEALEALDPTLRGTVKAYFFDENKGILTLKSKDVVRSGLTKLAEKISEAKNTYRNPNTADKDAAKKEVENLVKFQRDFLEQCYTYYPLGRFIRYRIFFDGFKCFEHLFDAQGESFDANEAGILDYTVEYAIYLRMEEANVKLQLKPEVGSMDEPKEVSPLEFYKEIIKRRVRRAGLAWNTKEKEIGEKLIEKLDAIVHFEEQPMDVETNKEEKKKLELEVIEVLDQNKVDIDKNVSKKFKKGTQAIKIGGFEAEPVNVNLKRELSMTLNVEYFDENFPQQKKPKK